MLVSKGANMEERIRQFNASLPDENRVCEPPDISRAALKDYLQKKYEFQHERFQLAFTYSAVVTIGVFVALIVAFGLNFFGLSQLPQEYRLYTTFIDWSSTAEFKVCSWDCEIIRQGTRLVNAAADIGASILSNEPDYYGNVAGIARLCTLITVTVVVWCTYRKKLACYYTYQFQPAQLEDFNTLPRWQFWLSRVLYTLASLFGTYVMISIAWFALSALFKNVTLDRFNAAIVIIIFTGAVTFGAAYSALVASTRTVLLLGLTTFVLGFSASFALSPLIDGRQWWERAVSNAGYFNPSAPIFTGTLLSGSIALWVLWYDLNSIIDRMIADGVIQWWKAETWMRVARVLYASFILGLISVGLVRVDDANFPSNKIFHAGGAVLAIASVVIAGAVVRKHRFRRWYRIFSVHILLGATVAIALLGSLRFNPPPVGFVFPGTGLISLTVIELALFVLIGVWVYITVDQLLDIANIQAFEESTGMAEKAES